MARTRTPSDPGPRLTTRTAVLLLAAGVLVHAPLGAADFSFDDRDFILVNESVRSLPAAWAALAQPFPPDQPERGLYRPLTNLSYAFDYALSGGSARVFHWLNVLLYLAVVLLIFALARRYGRATGFAFAVAFVFAMHPVHTGAVDALAGRSELLALGFGLASVLLFLRAVGGASLQLPALAGSLLAYAAACFSKETGVVLPAVLLVHVALFHPPASAEGIRRRNRALASLAPYALVLGGYLALRVSVLGRFSSDFGVLAGEPLGMRLITIGTVFFEYLRLLVFPADLQLDFYYHDLIGRPDQWTAAAALGALALVCAIVAFLALGVRRALRRGRTSSTRGDDLDVSLGDDGIALIALGIFLAFFFPVSHVIDIGAMMAERFLFAPSLGFVLAAVLGVDVLLRSSVASRRQRFRIVAGLLVVVALAGGWRSATRAAEWRDHVRLWERTVERIPRDTRALQNLAGAYLERNETAAARAVLERGLTIDPNHKALLGNLGVVQLQEGDAEGARSTYQRLVELDENDAIAWHNLGLAEEKRFRLSAAIEHFRRSVRLNPNFAPGHESIQRVEPAIERARSFLAEHPGDDMSDDPKLLNDIVAASVIVGDEARALTVSRRLESLPAASSGP